MTTLGETVHWGTMRLEWDDGSYGGSCTDGDAEWFVSLTPPTGKQDWSAWKATMRGTIAGAPGRWVVRVEVIATGKHWNDAMGDLQRAWGEALNRPRLPWL